MPNLITPMRRLAAALLAFAALGAAPSAFSADDTGNGRVLIIASAADTLELRAGKRISTGTYLNELAIPAKAIIAAGYDIVLATPTGTKPVIDARSRQASHFGGDEVALHEAEEFFATHPAMQQSRSLRAVKDAGLDEYAAVFVPGGHAPITDLARDADFGAILRHFHERAKPTALLCHAPIALIASVPYPAAFHTAMEAGNAPGAAQAAKGWPYAGYRMTVFSNEEEQGVETRTFQGRLKFYAVDALEAAGGRVTTASKPFEPNVVHDRELITGQNPRSDHALAAALVAALEAQTPQISSTDSDAR
ncbi:type 1 glutamine amidotransferase domain-containing protein [Pseudoxanthomonas putridarboris]|uniref:Type 1 glutamine amidotransferase domain-containing protein n=1 Tax=Pseudoxanthomonas putridarboris TaxID=752605 RepID=A0ABU9IZS5_9GAMM